MAVYRSDQAQLTFAAEAAQGADAEMNEGVEVGTRNGKCCHDCKIEDIINDIFRGE